MKIEIRQNVVIAKITEDSDQKDFLNYMERIIYPRNKPFVMINDLRGFELTATHRLRSVQHFIKNAYAIRRYLLGVAIITHDKKTQQAAERGIRWQVPLPFPTLLAFDFEEAFKWAQLVWWREAAARRGNPESE